MLVSVLPCHKVSNYDNNTCFITNHNHAHLSEKHLSHTWDSDHAFEKDTHTTHSFQTRAIASYHAALVALTWAGTHLVQ